MSCPCSRPGRTWRWCRPRENYSPKWSSGRNAGLGVKLQDFKYLGRTWKVMCTYIIFRRILFSQNIKTLTLMVPHRCAKELNQWDLVQDYGSSEASGNPLLVLESAWRVPNWARMKEALAHVEQSYPKELAWKVRWWWRLVVLKMKQPQTTVLLCKCRVCILLQNLHLFCVWTLKHSQINLYRGYLAICHPEEEHLKLVEKLVEQATVLCIREWKRLPHIVSHIHLPYLQAAQQVGGLCHQVIVHATWECRPCSQHRLSWFLSIQYINIAFK